MDEQGEEPVVKVEEFENALEVVAAAMKRMEERIDRLEQMGPSAQLLHELDVLRVQLDEVVIFRVDPKIEDESPGFHLGMADALTQAGLGGRAFVLAVEPRQADVTVVKRHEES